MTPHRLPIVLFSGAICALAAITPWPAVRAAQQSDRGDDFRASNRCIACHNNMKTASGADVSIGNAWRAGMMANSARDPYWQGSVRREALEHPESAAAIQNECASCHMPLQHFIDKEDGHDTAVFSRLPLSSDSVANAAAAEGVTCTVCHQTQPAGLGTPAAYNGNLPVAPAGTHPRPVFGPFDADPGHVTEVHVATSGYAPIKGDQMRQAALCGSCHTLYTTSRGPDGKQIGQLPEQMVYLEWLHSSYRDTQTCQQCHMPAVSEPVKIASILAEPRQGVHQHTFVGSNFLVEAILGAHHDELATAAQAAEFDASVARTTAFLQSQAARVTLGAAQLADGQLRFPVRVENLTGHKLPTSFPSRRAWLHVVVAAADGHIIFESGKLNPDGSIAGNANDADPTLFEPHFTTISAPDQVQIFEPILGDANGHVTTGLLSATQYLKDNRILPAGFDKKTATADIAVRGKAASDPDFTGGSSVTHYSIAPGPASGPFRVTVELVYQPIGFRWARNLAAFKADEPQRFVHYFDEAAAHSALVLAHAETTVNAKP